MLFFKTTYHESRRVLRLAPKRHWWWSYRWEYKIQKNFSPNPKSADFMAIWKLNFASKHPKVGWDLKVSPQLFEIYLAHFMSQMTWIFIINWCFVGDQIFDLLLITSITILTLTISQIHFITRTVFIFNIYYLIQIFIHLSAVSFLNAT